MGYRNTVSCRSLFKRLCILPLTSQYILSLMLLWSKTNIFFIMNSENHTKCTWQLNNLHHPIINLTVYKKGAHYMGIRILNDLPPPYIKEISNNIKKFENCLKRLLHIHSFYCLEEYFQYNLFTNSECFYIDLLYHFINMCNLSSVF